MKKISITAFIILLQMLNYIGGIDAQAQNNTKRREVEQYESYNMNITINGRTMSATMVANSSTKALKDILEEGSITFTANDYGGFEKVGGIGHTLPQNNEQIVTEPGDIILYMGSSICLYYAQNSWNFTRLGKINYTSESELKDFLNAGGGSIKVTLSLDTTSSVNSINAKSDTQHRIYNLKGEPVKPHLAKNGIFIVDGKKVKL